MFKEPTHIFAPIISLSDIKTTQTIENETRDEERSYYNIKNAELKNCTFAGPKDGESFFKECRDTKIFDSKFSLRYPLWHAINYALINSSFDEKTRAGIWYARNGIIDNCKIKGVKLLRESNNTRIQNSEIVSPEFGWKCDNLEINDSKIESEYMCFYSKNIKIKNLNFKGKYSFQYVENMLVENSNFDTKDAFWHTKNVTVKDSVLDGWYLAWFSENLTLINCKIRGTQPLCYCNGLKLINCTMDETDLSFEYSDVEADIKGDIMSIKNPKSGTITVDSVGEIIFKDSIMEANGKIVVRKKKE